MFKNANGVMKYIKSELHELLKESITSRNQTKFLFKRSSGRPERGIFLSCDIPRKEIRKVRASFMKSNNLEGTDIQKFIKNKILWFSEGQLVKNKSLIDTLNNDKEVELKGILTEFKNSGEKIAKDVIENLMKIDPNEGGAILTVMISNDSDSDEDSKYIGEIEEYRDFFKKGILLKKHKTLCEATCLTCNNIKFVQTFVERPLPFYYTDNPLYFPDGQELQSRKGFPLCDDCYLQLQKGVRFIKDYLSYSISQLGSDRRELNFWLIPHLNDPEILLDFKDEIDKNKSLYLNKLKYLCSSLRTISDQDESSRREGSRKNIESFLRFSSLFYKFDRHYMRVIQYTQGIYPDQLRRLIDVKEYIDNKYPFEKISKIFRYLNREPIIVGFPLIVFFYKEQKSKRGNNKKDDSKTEWQREAILLFSKIFTRQYIPIYIVIRKINSKIKNELLRSSNLISVAHTAFLGLVLIEYLISLNTNQSNEKMAETDSNPVPEETNIMTKQIADVQKFIENHDNILNDGTKRAVFAVAVCVGILMSVQEIRYNKTAPFWNRLNRLNLDLHRIKELLPEVKTKLAMYDERKYDTIINYLSMKEAFKIGAPSSKEWISFIFSVGLSYGYMVAREYI